MNYYRRYLGDYMRDTMHLSIMEHGAYNLLLDGYYATEKPLPADFDGLYRICRAMSKAEQDAVKRVAGSFFPIGEDGLRHNRRADHELNIGQATIAKQRQSGVDSAAKRWSTDKSTHESTNRSAIQPPTTNHQPLTTNLPTSNHQVNPAAKAADPVKEEIWKTGKTLLANGDDTKAVGSFLGKLCKEYGQILVLQAVRDCTVATPAEPKAWLVARCQERRALAGNKSAAIETRNHAAVDQAMKEAAHG